MATNDDNEDELREEKRGLVRWLLDVAFGRKEDTHKEEHQKVHRLGEVNRKLGEE